jgi:DcuC family C4-dicarboxylate transporter
MALLVTIILFAILIFGILKKIDLRCLFLGEIFLILIYLTATGTNVMGDASSGNVIMDWFVYLSNSIVSNIGGIVLSMMLMISYVEILNRLRATDMLAYYLKKPLGLTKNPYLAAVVVVVIGTLVRICISIAPPAAALIIGTFMPILLSLGCPFETACVAMLIYHFCWGPADPSCLAASQLMGIEVNLAEWFIKMQLPLSLVFLAVLAVAFVITAKINDKKGFTIKEASIDLEQRPDVPCIYALLPLLPVIFMLICSPFVCSWISIDINTACLASLVITIIIAVICEKSVKIIPTLMNDFCSSVGENYKNLGLMVVFALTFASSLNMVGGLNILANLITGLSVPSVFIVLIVAAFGALVNGMIGSFFGSLSIVLPLAGAVSANAGIDPAALCFVAVMGCSIGCLCSPINPIVLFVAEKCEIGIGNLIKRTAPAAVIALLVMGVAASVLF